MDLDACTRHLDVVDEESEELLTLVEVEPVDAGSRSLGEVGDASLQAGNVNPNWPTCAHEIWPTPRRSGSQTENRAL